MSFDQGKFNFAAGNGDAGYRRWREERRAFEHRWGVILDRPVRIRLEGHNPSIEGTIRLFSPPRAAKP